MKKKTIWLIGMGTVLATTAALFFLKRRKGPTDTEEKPPKNAPQLDVQNPGEQSEFPSMADESELER